MNNLPKGEEAFKLENEIEAEFRKIDQGVLEGFCDYKRANNLKTCISTNG